MPDEEKQVEPPELVAETRTVNFQIEIVPPEQYVYSNVSSISISPWDVSVNFADVRPEMATPELKSKAIVGVVMPPEHAAGLVILLTAQLRTFEKQFGKIRHSKWRAIADESAAQSAKK